MCVVYWYNTVLVVLTRSASSVDVECMLSILRQILNGNRVHCIGVARILSVVHFSSAKRLTFFSRRPQNTR